MSAAIASARKRRAPASVNPSPVTNVQQQPDNQSNANPTSPQGGLTLPQVIALVDRRLVTLESFMNETKTATSLSEAADAAERNESQLNTIPESSNEELIEVVNEFNSRFELFAGELNEIKNIILKLQSFTMEVNQKLVDERSQLLTAVSNDRDSTESNSSQTNTDTITVVPTSSPNSTNANLENIVFYPAVPSNLLKDQVSQEIQKELLESASTMKSVSEGHTNELSISASAFT